MFLKEYLILDGYNVINSWPRLNILMNQSLENARDELINIMAEYSAFKGIDVIIVFDAYLVKARIGGKNKFDKVEVVFTKEKETADSYIEKLVAKLCEKNRVTVVTNDWAEQQMVLGSGGIRLTVRELILEFEQIKSKINKKIEMPKGQKNTLTDMMDKSTLEKLERFRRGK